MFLSRLQSAGRADRMVEVCRQIRRCAGACGVRRAGIFTYRWQMNACEDLHDFDSMWRVLRAQERAMFGKYLNLRKHQWKDDDFHQLVFVYGPLLYKRRSFRLGCELMETALRLVSTTKGWSFEALWHVYKPLPQPVTISDVTLAHFYSAMGLSLTEWPLWTRFVGDLHPKLFRMSGVSKGALLKDEALLKPFFEWIVLETKRRLFSGGTHGLRDLIEPPGKVRERQAATKEKILAVDEDPRRELLERRLQDLFPELLELPAQPSLRRLLEKGAD